MATLKQIGHARGCFGTTSDPATLNLYIEATLAGVSFTELADCRTLKQGFPESGITVYRCYLELRALSNGYVGGLLTTNTVISGELLGNQSQPPGYTQASVATELQAERVRSCLLLQKRRDEFLRVYPYAASSPGFARHRCAAPEVFFEDPMQSIGQSAIEEAHVALFVVCE
jgi:hypothetical protein